MLALVAYGGWQLLKLYQEVDGAGENGEIQTITIEQGSSVADIAAQLESSGIVQHGWLFRYYTQYSGRAEGLQYGDFELYPWHGLQRYHHRPVRAEGPPPDHPRHHPGRHHRRGCGAAVCGTRAWWTASRPSSTAPTGRTVRTSASMNSGTRSPITPTRLFKCEGYLFPETYEFFTDATVYEIVDTLYAQFDAETADLMATVAEKGTTLDDVVILASFIQEEAGRAGGGLQGQRLLPQPSGIGRPAVE